MPCGSCGSGPRPTTRYELTTPDGQRRVFLSEIEARIASTRAGGGTIRPVTPA